MFGDFLSLLAIRDVFAQAREYRSDSFLSKSLSRFHRVCEGFSRHETGNRALHEAVVRRVIAQPPILRRREQNGSHQTHERLTYGLFGFNFIERNSSAPF